MLMVSLSLYIRLSLFLSLYSLYLCFSSLNLSNLFNFDLPHLSLLFVALSLSLCVLCFLLSALAPLSFRQFKSVLLSLSLSRYLLSGEGAELQSIAPSQRKTTLKNLLKCVVEQIQFISGDARSILMVFMCSTPPPASKQQKLYIE